VLEAERKALEQLALLSPEQTREQEVLMMQANLNEVA
jgi:hypothetical protein